MSNQTKLAELYTAFFGRAPDAGGLAYWSNQLETGNMSLDSMAGNWMQEQPEALERYPASLDTRAFIQQIYANILGRSADPEGQDYWQQELESGGVSREVFVLAVVNGAKANTSEQGRQDAALLDNKATVGLSFAARGLNDTELASKVLDVVTSDEQSVSLVDSLLDVLPEGGEADAELTASLVETLDSLGSAAPAALARVLEFMQTVVVEKSHGHANSPQALLRAIANAAQHSDDDGQASIDGTAAADTLDGGAGNELISGFDGDDALFGGAGDDVLDGGTGNDVLIDRSGTNTFFGGAGDDQLSGSRGDTFTGGEGADTFSVQWLDGQGQAGGAAAIITDFDVSEDILDLGMLLGEAETGLESTLLIGFAGGNPFDLQLGYLSFVDTAEGAVLMVDLDGVAGTAYEAQALIQLTGVAAADIQSGNLAPQFDPLAGSVAG